MTDWVVLNGSAVRQARHHRHPSMGGWRQLDISRDLAKIGVGWGFSQGRISSIERETNLGHLVTPWQATALAATLGVPVWDILAPAEAQTWNVLRGEIVAVAS